MDDGTVLVAFELPEAVSATTVSVVGDFNGWTAQTHPLTPVEGGFRADIALPAGDRWRFRYLLDGQRWENDWAADDYVPNGFGDDDSVVDLTNPTGLSLAALAGPAQPAADTAPAAETAPAADGAADAGASAADIDPAAGVEAAARRPGLLRRWWHRVTARWSRRTDRRSRAAADEPRDLAEADAETQFVVPV